MNRREGDVVLGKRPHSHLGDVFHTILSALLVTGISWLLFEVNENRERWARLEEKMAAQSEVVLEIKRDLRRNVSSAGDLQNSAAKRLRHVESRISVLESKLEPRSRAN